MREITNSFASLAIIPALEIKKNLILTRNRIMSSGSIVQIIGAVIDVEFPRDSVPNVYDALQRRWQVKRPLKFNSS